MMKQINCSQWRTYRQMLGIRYQVDMANLLGIKKQQYYTYERGIKAMPDEYRYAIFMMLKDAGYTEYNIIIECLREELAK